MKVYKVCVMIISDWFIGFIVRSFFKSYIFPLGILKAMGLSIISLLSMLRDTLCDRRMYTTKYSILKEKEIYLPPKLNQ